MKKQSLQSRPPKINNDLEAFIEGAENKSLKLVDSTNFKDPVVHDKAAKVIVHESEIFPWEENQVRIDVKKNFTLRLSEPDMLKLQFIQKKTNKSMQKFCLEYLIPAIETEIHRLKDWHY